MGDSEQPRLDSSLAQKVVDTIAPMINRNVNIMNAHGVIIASTDVARIGSHHGSSAEAIERNQIIRVSRSDGSAGTQPGVNVPLALNGQLCGVVGVTGAPHEVEPLAGLIALTVQLLFAQEREHSRSVRRETEARDLLSALLSGRAAPEVIERALLGYGLRGSKGIDMWIPRNPDDAVLEDPAVNGINTSWIPLSGAYWRLRASDEQVRESRIGLSERYLESIPVLSASDLLAEAEAQRVLLSYPSLVPMRGSRQLWSREIAVAIARTPSRSLKHLATIAQSLNQEQCKTLLMVAVATSMSQAAEALHIHRNTLVQRLERIAQVAGVDIRNSSESLKLQHAIYARVALGEMHIF